MFSVLPNSAPYFWIYGVNNPTETQITQQDQLLNTCLNSTTNACKTQLQTRCANFTREDLMNPTIRKFCACFLPEEFYESRRECDTLCQEYDSVQFTYGNTCTQAACVIDNIVINSQGGRLGRINISQICPTCLIGSCTCIINDVNLIAGPAVKGLNINQTCGPDSKCFIRTQEGLREEISCNSSMITQGRADEANTVYNIRDLVLLGLAVLIIILSLITLLVP